MAKCEPFVAFPKGLYDLLLLAPAMTEGPLKVALATVRLTLGYHGKRSARIRSLEIARRTGLNHRTVKHIRRDMLAEGFLVETAPRRGTMPAEVRINPDAHGWGRYAPDLPCVREGRREATLECIHQCPLGTERGTHRCTVSASTNALLSASTNALSSLKKATEDSFSEEEGRTPFDFWQEETNP